MLGLRSDASATRRRATAPGRLHVRCRRPLARRRANLAPSASLLSRSATRTDLLDATDDAVGRAADLRTRAWTTRTSRPQRRLRRAPERHARYATGLRLERRWHYRLGDSSRAGSARRTYAISHVTRADADDPTTSNRRTALNAVRLLRHVGRASRADLRLGADGGVRPTWTPGASREFYFAQIERVHAGKTMQIQPLAIRATPGRLSADLQILVRARRRGGLSTDYQPVELEVDNGHQGQQQLRRDPGLDCGRQSVQQPRDHDHRATCPDTVRDEPGSIRCDMRMAGRAGGRSSTQRRPSTAPTRRPGRSTSSAIPMRLATTATGTALTPWQATSRGATRCAVAAAGARAGSGRWSSCWVTLAVVVAFAAARRVLDVLDQRHAPRRADLTVGPVEDRQSP